MTVDWVAGVILFFYAAGLLVMAAGVLVYLGKGFYHLTRRRWGDAGEDIVAAVVGAGLWAANAWLYQWLFNRWVTLN